MIKVLDLFSGIGGFAYASERIVGGFETVAFCEIDPFCQKVLEKNFPGVPIHNDIKELEKNAIRYRGYVDVVCGGFPCQPWSNAGKKEGHEDKKGRDLWGEMASIIKQILPRFVIGENVRGFAQMPMGLQRSVNDLESIGYRVANFIIPSAYALGLPHRRERCWIIAEYVGNTKYNGSSSSTIRRSNRNAEEWASEGQNETFKFEGTSGFQNDKTLADTDSKRLQGFRQHKQLEGEQREDEFAKSSTPTTKDLGNSNGIRQQRSGKTIRSINPKKDKIRETSRADDASKGQRSIRKSFLRMGNVADGISERLAYDYTIEPKDLPRVVKGEKQRADKLKALGNSIIPQCVAVFFQSIKDCYCEHDR